MSKFMCVATPIRDEEYCLNEYLSNVVPLFDGVVTVVDDRTVDNSENILKERGVITEKVTFIDFAQLGNTLLDKCRALGYKYAFILNPDERILPNIFKDVKQYVLNNDPSVDVYLLARRNWYDLEMTNERKDVFPDYQCKIINLQSPTLEYVGKVHETIRGAKRILQLPTHLTTEHFNLYYYSTGDQDYEAKIAQYNDLALR